jgi:hypothetical protein
MQHQPVSDPFALIMDPDAVFKAMESSDRLGRLKRRICRPLDKPLIPKVGDEAADAFDHEVDAAPELPDALDV